jgi:ParB/RepB/Spo0J family partition protein
MTSTSTQEGFREIPVGALVFSASSAQAERRKHFDDAMLKELVDSVATTGILQPIVVRPNGKPDTFEVVAGERRVIAARKAKLETVPAMVRALDDGQALDVQLIENLQREGLHPLVEAEGYETLKKNGHSVKEIAAKVSRSEAYVYKRLELSGCIKEVRAAFFDDKIDASRALLLSTVKDPEQQKSALKDITTPDWQGSIPSFRQAVRIVRDEYRLRLAEAAFDTESANLLPDVGPCGKCPKNTSLQPADMFGDVSKDPRALCTDSVCFRRKTKASADIQIEQARATGATIITGDAAKKIIPEGAYRHQPKDSSGFVALDEHCDDDSKGRTWRQILGKHVQPTLVVTPKDSVVTEVVKLSDVKKVIKDKGIKLETRSSSSGPSADSIAQKKRNQETKFRGALYAAIRPKLPSKLGRPELEQLAMQICHWVRDEERKALRSLWDPEKTGGSWEWTNTFEKRIPKLKDDELVLFILDSLYAGELRASTYGHSKSEPLLAAAKRVRVDPDKIKVDLAAAKKTKKGASKK